MKTLQPTLSLLNIPLYFTISNANLFFTVFRSSSMNLSVVKSSVTCLKAQV
jgi:hypothetical protein